MGNKLTKLLMVGFMLTIGVLSYSSSSEGGAHEGKLNREEQLIIEQREKEAESNKVKEKCGKDSKEQEEAKEEMLKQMERDSKGGPHNNN